MDVFGKNAAGLGVRRGPLGKVHAGLFNRRNSCFGNACLVANGFVDGVFKRLKNGTNKALGKRIGGNKANVAGNRANTSERSFPSARVPAWLDLLKV